MKITKKESQEITNILMSRPVKETKLNIPKYNSRYIEYNAVQQADILVLPNNRGFKYLLVVVDLGSKLCDAYPLKNKSTSSVKKAFEKIYNNNILNIPSTRLEVDNGSEFKSIVAEYFENKNVYVRVGLTNRHRQQAMVERYNQLISIQLFKEMMNKEIINNKINKMWIDNYKQVINNINKKASEYRSNDIEYNTPIVNSNSKASKLLTIGDYVLTALDYPIDFTGKKLHGSFRSTDFRFDPKLKIIYSTILKPGVPPMYLVHKENSNQIIHAAYTRNQLLLLNDHQVKLFKKLNINS